MNSERIAQVGARCDERRRRTQEPAPAPDETATAAAAAAVVVREAATLAQASATKRSGECSKSLFCSSVAAPVALLTRRTDFDRSPERNDTDVETYVSKIKRRSKMCWSTIGGRRGDGDGGSDADACR